MMDMDQSQRRDIDLTLNDRLTLAIDEENVSDSPIIVGLDVFTGNNWYVDSNSKIRKLNVAEDDKIVFHSEPLDNLLYKAITNVVVSFDYTVSNNVTFPLLSSISLGSGSVVSYKNAEIVLDGQGHVDVVCDKFGLSDELLNTAISVQGFDIGILFDGVKSNASLSIWNVNVAFEFDNILDSEIRAVSNRVSSSFDVYVEEDNLIFDFLGDGEGEHHTGGGVDVDTVNRLIREAISRLDITVNLELLNNGYVRLSTDLDKDEV